MVILVTGMAGFIGFHLCRQLAGQTNITVIGVDSLNDYYDPQLKRDRLQALGIEVGAPGTLINSSTLPNLHFQQLNLEDEEGVRSIFETHRPEVVINLAAQAGVRYSLDHPLPYIKTNVLGFTHLLEGARYFGVKHFIYASSSSVYGLNRKMPFSPADAVDHPVSLYAATKRSNELLAHTYSHLYGLPTTGLRFFTVYGPYGRPDMAYFSFTRDILEGKTIRVFNHGNMRRDFTYIDDVVEAIVRLVDHPPQGGKSIDRPDESPAPFALYNIGNHSPVRLLDFIKTIEQALGKKANMELLPMQPGDVEETYADIEGLQELVDFQPQTPLSEGLPRFVEWYRSYYGV
jgi:UDP-glucuronate 4-epimerase